MKEFRVSFASGSAIRKALLTLASVASILHGSPSRANPVIVNPYFATPDYTSTSSGWAYLGVPSQTTVDGWTYTQYVGVSDLAAGVWFSATPPVGQQAAFDQNGTISQTVSGFTPGNNYNFSLYMAQRLGHNPNPVTVSIDSIDLGVFSPPSVSQFTQFTTSDFTATSSSMTLAFTVNPPSCNPYSVSCDWASSITDVSVQAPEPNPMAIFGMAGLLLFALRLRRRS